MTSGKCSAGPHRNLACKGIVMRKSSYGEPKCALSMDGGDEAPAGVCQVLLLKQCSAD